VYLLQGDGKMTRSQSKYQFYQEASLSQKLADKIPDYVELAGSDPETSTAIQAIKDLITLKLIDKDNEGIKIILTLLNGRRKALFATSEKVNEITKMGMQMPKGEDIISDFDEEE
jgi:hypothetical protein